MPAPVHGRGEAMEMREPRAHEIAREAAACLAEIDETIPVLLEAMVLGEMADIGPARWPFSRRVADISRQRRFGKRGLPLAAQRTKRCRKFYAGVEGNGRRHSELRTSE